MGGHKKFIRLWILVISGVLVLFYSIWWVVVVYVPYGKKKESLREQIIALEQEIGRKDEKWRLYRKAEERLGASMNSIQVIRSKLPDLRNLEKIVKHLKEAGIAEIFGPGTTTGDIVKYICENIKRCDKIQ